MFLFTLALNVKADALLLADAHPSVSEDCLPVFCPHNLRETSGLFAPESPIVKLSVLRDISYGLIGTLRLLTAAKIGLKGSAKYRILSNVVVMQNKLENLAQMMRDEQRKLLEDAAASSRMPAGNALQRIAYLELNIAAIENILIEEQ